MMKKKNSEISPGVMIFYAADHYVRFLLFSSLYIVYYFIFIIFFSLINVNTNCIIVNISNIFNQNCLWAVVLAIYLYESNGAQSVNKCLYFRRFGLSYDVKSMKLAIFLIARHQSILFWTHVERKRATN